MFARVARIGGRIVAAAGLAAGLGCSAGPEIPELISPPPCPQIAAVTLTPGDTALAIGDSLRFSATASAPCPTTETPTPVAWMFQSSNPEVLGVDSAAGWAVGRSVGLAAIRATGTRNGASVSGAAAINVGRMRLQVATTAASITAGDQAPFAATLIATGAPVSVRWSLSDPAAGSISPAGVLTACWPGGFATVAAVGIDDSTLRGSTRIRVGTPPFTKVQIAELTDVATGARVVADALQAEVDVRVETDPAWVPCRRIVAVSLSIDDGRGSGTVLGESAVDQASGTIVRHFRFRPEGFPNGRYGLQASVRVEAGYTGLSDRVGVRIQHP